MPSAMALMGCEGTKLGTPPIKKSVGFRPGVKQISTRPPASAGIYSLVGFNPYGGAGLTPIKCGVTGVARVTINPKTLNLKVNIYVTSPLSSLCHGCNNKKRCSNRTD